MSKTIETTQVYLVGAGPGDPELLTVKAWQAIQKADILVYDRLVGEEILDLAPAAAQRFFVGKESGRHPVPQHKINSLLVGLASPGRTVVRLKGGDPFIFGRGSEEAEELRNHDIPYEVIPGITSASGCLAEVGVPLTHRGMATSVRLVTGHRKADESLDLNWKSLADPDTTLVFYMALANLPEISERLIEAGLAPDTPAAAIRGGTLPGQQLCTGTLADISQRVAEAGLVPPALIVIGQVASFARDRGNRPVDITAEFAAFVREAGHA
ncbi:MAG: uroporphyrinogen-III C-methyltransferase [Alphaproteobacteria bacterium]|nr:uroporphyrinogen-III C-methyltransferase [Alphaproteobacteria bacterium]